MRLLSSKSSVFMGKHNDFGKEGEEIATNYLIEKGYSIQRRNYRFRRLEIDIIAQKGDVLAIVEVRARSDDRMMPIAETVTPKKIQRLVRAANHYVTSNNLHIEVRFDIITILKNFQDFKIEHLENAFSHY